LRKKFLVLLILSSLLLFLSSCGSTKASENQPALTATEIQQMYTDPSSFKGRTVELIGQVFTEPEYDSNGVYFQMFNDITNSDRNTLVAYAKPDFQLKTDDYVKITGVIDAEATGKNAFGAEMTAPSIIASNVQILSYVDAISPTIKEVTLTNPTQSQKGYSVTVDKIEFAQTETRVYVTVKNSGTSTFSLYSFNAKITQNGKQYEEQTNYDAEYPEIQPELLPENTTTGVIAFPKLEQADFKIIFEAYSENWEETINPYTFNVTVK